MSDQFEELVAPDASDVRGVVKDDESGGAPPPGDVTSLADPAICQNASVASEVADLFHEIKNLHKEDAIGRIDALREKTNRGNFELGGVLSVIQRNKWFDPHKSFKRFVLDGLGMDYRTALYFVGIYDKISELGLPYDLFQGLGWTKLRMLVPVLTTENAERWVKRALEISKPELAKVIEEATTAPRGQPTPMSKGTVVKTFRFRDEQMEHLDSAIKRARAWSGAKDDSEAIDYVCRRFLNRPTLKQSLSHLPPESAARLLADALEGFDENTFINILKACAANRAITFSDREASGQK